MSTLTDMFKTDSDGKSGFRKAFERACDNVPEIIGAHHENVVENVIDGQTLMDRVKGVGQALASPVVYTAAVGVAAAEALDHTATFHSLKLQMEKRADAPAGNAAQNTRKPGKSGMGM